jgi:polysaccharide biosynthesis protein PslH
VTFCSCHTDKIRSWHILKALTAIAPVHVCTLVDDPRDLEHIDMLRNICASVHTQPRTLSKSKAALFGLLQGLPASVAAFSSAALQADVDRVLADNDVATIFAFSGQMAQFVKPGKARFVMDFVDADSAKFLTYADQSKGLAALANRFEGIRLAAYETRVSQRADLNLLVSEAEASLFRSYTGLEKGQVRALENGIDLALFDPALPRASVTAENTPLIVFTGQMDYRPNVDAVAAFARTVLPLVRRTIADAQFAIVGRAPTAEVLSLAKIPGVIVTGEVADTRDWLAAARLIVAPLKLARGIQNKVLEAMAMAKPVVLSSAAAHGIDAVPGRDFLVADTDVDAGSAIISLLLDPAFGQKIGTSARRRMITRYGWDARLAGLRDIVKC